MIAALSSRIMANWFCLRRALRRVAGCGGLDWVCGLDVDLLSPLARVLVLALPRGWGSMAGKGD